MPFSSNISPGHSSVAAKINPETTAHAPVANDFTMSPEFFIPASGINVLPNSFAAFAVSIKEVNIGTPQPVLILVVQIDPAPMPTSKLSAPALYRSRAHS